MVRRTVTVEITIDDEVDAAYVYLVDPAEARGSIARCLGSVEEGVVVDVDAEGRVLGIEVLGAARRLAARP